MTASEILKVRRLALWATDQTLAGNRAPVAAALADVDTERLRGLCAALLDLVVEVAALADVRVDQLRALLGAPPRQQAGR